MREKSRTGFATDSLNMSKYAVRKGDPIKEKIK